MTTQMAYTGQKTPDIMRQVDLPQEVREMMAALPGELALRAAVLKGLEPAVIDIHDCARSWDDWDLGQMRDSDFLLLVDQAQRLEEISEQVSEMIHRRMNRVLDSILRVKSWPGALDAGIGNILAEPASKQKMLEQARQEIISDGTEAAVMRIFRGGHVFYDSYSCGRDWEDWEQGRMSSADFHHVPDDMALCGRIAAAIMASLRTEFGPKAC